MPCAVEAVVRHSGAGERGLQYCVRALGVSGRKGTPEGIYALDTGCCWGGELTCLRWEDKQYFVQPSNRQMDMGEGEAVNA